MPEPLRCLLYVSDQRRDLEGLALVGFHLRRLGAEVAYCTIQDISERVAEGHWDAVVLDQLKARLRKETAVEVRNRGGAVIILPTAAFFVDPRLETDRLGGTRAGLADAYLAWGERSRATLAESGAIDGSKVMVTGAPRFDFYREPLLSRMTPSRQELFAKLGFKRADQPLVIWSSGSHVRRWKSLGSLLNRIRLRYKMSAHDWSDVLDERTLFQDGTRLIAALAAHGPGWNILIKVHPLEDVEPYWEMARDRPNVRVVQDVPIREILPYAAVHIQRASTTAFEAWLLGKPVVELVLSRFRLPSPEEALLGNEKVSSVGEALASVDRYVRGGPIPPEQAAVRPGYLSNACGVTDGRSAERCAGAIVDVTQRVVAPRLGAPRIGRPSLTSTPLDLEAGRLYARFEALPGSDDVPTGAAAHVGLGRGAAEGL